VGETRRRKTALWKNDLQLRRGAKLLAERHLVPFFHRTENATLLAATRADADKRFGFGELFGIPVRKGQRGCQMMMLLQRPGMDFGPADLSMSSGATPTSALGAVCCRFWDAWTKVAQQSSSQAVSSDRVANDFRSSVSRQHRRLVRGCCKLGARHPRPICLAVVSFRRSAARGGRACAACLDA